MKKLAFLILLLFIVNSPVSTPQMAEGEINAIVDNYFELPATLEDVTLIQTDLYMFNTWYNFTFFLDDVIQGYWHISITALGIYTERSDGWNSTSSVANPYNPYWINKLWITNSGFIYNFDDYDKINFDSNYVYLKIIYSLNPPQITGLESYTVYDVVTPISMRNTLFVSAYSHTDGDNNTTIIFYNNNEMVSEANLWYNGIIYHDYVENRTLSAQLNPNGIVGGGYLGYTNIDGDSRLTWNNVPIGFSLSSISFDGFDILGGNDQGLVYRLTYMPLINIIDITNTYNETITSTIVEMETQVTTETNTETETNIDIITNIEVNTETEYVTETEQITNTYDETTTEMELQQQTNVITETDHTMVYQTTTIEDNRTSNEIVVPSLIALAVIGIVFVPRNLPKIGKKLITKKCTGCGDKINPLDKYCLGCGIYLKEK